MISIALRSYWVVAIRVFCLIGLALSSISVNVYSSTFFVLTFISLYVLKKQEPINFKLKQVNLENLENPYKRTKKLNLPDVSDELISKTKEQLFNFVYRDYSNAESLQLFAEIKDKSDCVFAKKSSLWGSPAWKKELTIKENIYLNVIGPFILFTNFCIPLKLDGFLIQLPGDVYGKNIEDFARAFCEILTSISECDPEGRNCMDSDKIDNKEWVFEFNDLTFFITTFAPFYTTENPRYTFGVNECFILFQPEISFAYHNLPTDTPVTNWNEPKSVRDKIRVKFKTSGREYLIRDTINYPISHDMIRPLNVDDGLVEWWKYKNSF